MAGRKNEKENKKSENVDEETEKYRKRMFWLKLCEYISAAALLLCIFIPLTVVVVCQIDSGLKDYKEAATLISTFTSIILGFVAMTVSLIGMVLSFHNTRQTEDSNLSTTKEFTKLDGSVAALKEHEERLNSSVEKISERINTLDKQMGTFDEMKKKVDSMQHELNNISSYIKLLVDRTTKGEAPINVVPTEPKDPGDDDYDG